MLLCSESEGKTPLSAGKSLARIDNIFIFVFLGQNRTVTCSVTGARPTPVIKWFKNHHELRGSELKVMIDTIKISF